MSFIFGPLMIDLQGLTLTVEEREMLNHPLVGGVILFSRNYAEATQLAELCRAVRACVNKPLLISVDQEGGRVQRFKRDFTLLPSMRVLGELYARKPSLALQVTKQCGWLLAAELLASGVDFSFAPVLDLFDHNNPVIGDRAFHSDPQCVTKLGYALMQGMHAAGMVAVGKHFPGHGLVNIDSHFKLPEDMRDFEKIFHNDMQPFIDLIGLGLDGIMMAHILFPKVDAQIASCSSYWIKKILRDRCCFSGMIFSDDLNMEAVKMKDSVTCARQALHAGCDMIMLCNNSKELIHILEHLPKDYSVEEKKYRAMQGKFSVSLPWLKKTSLWQQSQTQLMRAIAIEG